MNNIKPSVCTFDYHWLGWVKWRLQDKILYHPDNMKRLITVFHNLPDWIFKFHHLEGAFIDDHSIGIGREFLQVEITSMNELHAGCGCQVFIGAETVEICFVIGIFTFPLKTPAVTPSLRKWCTGLGHRGSDAR